MMVKNILKTIGIILFSLIGLFVLLFIVGYIVDIFSGFSLNAMSGKARTDLMNSKMEIKENAWDDYLKAIKEVTSIKFDYETDRYLRGEKNLSSSYPEEIKNYPDIYPIIIQGNNKSACQMPYNYSEGWKMELPDFIAMQKITKILAIRAMQALKQNEAEKSVDYTTQGLMFCDHVIRGGPVLINYMVGIVIYGITLKPLKYGIENGNYNADQLRKISVVLSHCEKALPLLSWALKGESDITKINRFNFSLLRVRLSCWQYFFSPKLALFRGLNIAEKAIKSLRIDEDASLGKFNEDIPRGYKYIDDSLPGKYMDKNPVLPFAETNFSSMLRRKIELVAKIRSLKLAAEIREVEARTGSLPKTLEGLDTLAVIDPMSGKKWNYMNTGDSVVISGSPFDSHNVDRIVYLVIKKWSQ